MTRAGIYARISADAAGKGLGVQRQVKSCEQLAEAFGWDVANVYVDNDVSATRSKIRPEYQRLLADMQTRRIDAVLVWSLDRLHRRPVELEHFIAVAEQSNILLANVSGEVDLHTTNGQLHARLMGAVAAAEARRIGDRVRAKQDQLRQAGLPAVGGKRCYGWEADRLTPIPSEQAEIRNMVRMLLEGHSLGSIARDLNRRGVETVSQWHARQPRNDGKELRASEWTTTSLRNLLGLPRLVGDMVHRGEVVGRGAWDPVLTREQFAQVQVMLARRAAPFQRVQRPASHLLSGIATCAVCGRGLQFASQGRERGEAGRRYKCPSGEKGHGSRSGAKLDAYVTARLFEVLDLMEVPPPPSEDQAERMDALRQRLDEAADLYSTGVIDGEQLARISGALRPQIEALQVATPVPAVRRLWQVLLDAETDEEAARAWEALDVSQKRLLLSTTLGERGFIKVAKAKRTSRWEFDSSTVWLRWSLGNEAAMPN